MQAQAWTAIGLLAATLLGALFYLGNRIDMLGSELRSEMRGQFQEIRAEVGGQFPAQRSRIDDLSFRIETLSVRVDSLAVRVEEQGHQLADRIYELALKLDDHLRRHAS